MAYIGEMLEPRDWLLLVGTGLMGLAFGAGAIWVLFLH